MRLSDKSLRVLAAFLSDPSIPLAGSDLFKLTKVGAGTLYPMLLRFEAQGWLDSEWEAIEPSLEKRPRKRFYKLTGEGRREASELLSQLRTIGGLQWAI
ncbi:PadR family transcriptional regulator [Beijerinckia sp. L45]|uniref:PadR family transcriptional regulator n=1 Tax=Beijerinckia sp. L45 TaxID=1641855 RepID=UPI0034CDECE7